jgi:hypothetical protein
MQYSIRQAIPQSIRCPAAELRIWLTPFYLALVEHLTVLQLSHDKKTDLHHITSQNDLYQVNELVCFVWLGG